MREFSGVVSSIHLAIVAVGLLLFKPLCADDRVDLELIAAVIDASSKATTGFEWDFEFEQFECPLSTDPIKERGAKIMSKLFLFLPGSHRMRRRSEGKQRLRCTVEALVP